MRLVRIRQFLWLAVMLGLGFGLLPAVALAQSPSPFSDASTSSASITNLMSIILITGGVIYVLVQGAIILAPILFRRRSDALPPQWHGNTRLEITWTVVPAIILLLILYLTVQTLSVTRYTAEASGDEIAVDVIGHQWWWEYRYEKQGITTASDLVVPVNTRIHLRIWSDDVIHSFWIPQLAGKTDANPLNFLQEGQNVPGGAQRVGPGVNILNSWFQATKTGTYEGQCAEYCGEQHAIMRMRVKVVDQAEWNTWVQRNQAEAQPVANAANIERGKAVFQNPANLCAGCHVIKGVTNPAQPVGPNLSNIGGRLEIGAGALPNTPENLRAWIRNAPSIKSGIKMPAITTLSDADLDALVAYLWSLK